MLPAWHEVQLLANASLYEPGWQAGGGPLKRSVGDERVSDSSSSESEPGAFKLTRWTRGASLTV